MEAPASWGPVEHAIAEAMQEAEQARADGIIGLSTVRRIADKLRERGLVVAPVGVANAEIRDELAHNEHMQSRPQDCNRWPRPVPPGVKRVRDV